MKSCPFYSYLWKKYIFLQLTVAHKKQIQLPAKHKHDQALQWAIKTSHVAAARGRSFYWRTVTPINKHKVSVQPVAPGPEPGKPLVGQEERQGFPREKLGLLLLLRDTSASTEQHQHPALPKHLSSSQLHFCLMHFQQWGETSQKLWNGHVN